MAASDQQLPRSCAYPHSHTCIMSIQRCENWP